MVEGLTLALLLSVAQGDAAWTRRAEDGFAVAAIEAYGDAVEADPADVEARARLLRALWFVEEFEAETKQRRRALLDRATRLADEGVEQLALRDLEPEAIRARVREAGLSPEHVGELYFWSAIAWGAWSRFAGLLSSVREGVANRAHDYALVTVALAPETAQGGAHRLLAELHARLPRVPFVSGWVDRDRAIPEAERAYAIDPDYAGNQLLLARLLLDLAPGRRAEALDLLERAAGSEPRPSHLVEDRAIRDAARKRLAEERERAQAP